ncbi:hypothetical protein WICPIJ_005288 [Wickerhamomyces pijperi]|uniref:DNA polymerase epsilon subunit B n=1 Tax=Wickerhamomyces pijperi TaxID=599730 RepID=A0A9P8Q611_WICPI|nr:hypothetical protein WICPIJ_005288 [Wickerhamomyces pijperi]
MEVNKPVVLPIQIQPANLRPFAFRIFSKKHALNIKTDALEVLSNFIGLRYGSEWRGVQAQMFMEEIAKLWKSQERGMFLTGEGVKDVIEELQSLERKTIASNRKANAGRNDPRGKGIDSLIRGKENSPENNELGPEEAPQLSTDEDGEDEQVEQTSAINWKDHFEIVSTHDQERFSYDPVAKRFVHVRDNEEATEATANSEDLINLFLQRYHIVKDRVLRNENFQISNPLASFSAGDSSFDGQQSRQITLIKNLIGRNNQRFFLFGMLVIKQGELCLEDASDSIILKFPQKPQLEDCYFTEGSFVLVEGVFDRGVFFCVGIHPPFAERRITTIEAIHNFDFLNPQGNFRIDIKLKQNLRSLEQQLNHKIIFMGINCFLDQPRTFDGLRKFFTELVDSSSYEDLPIAIVFQGSFTSTSKHSTEYKALFNQLAALLEGFPAITNNVHLIFIPGPNDLWNTSAYPKQPIPKVFTSRLDKLCKKITWASNPVRIKYLSREIVIFRDDLNGCFKRNNIDFDMISSKTGKEAEAEAEEDTEGEDERQEIDKLPTRLNTPRKLIRTILTQSHLLPFTRNVKNIVWSQDHVLRLTPIPNLLVLGDASSNEFMVTYNGCTSTNPGPLINRRKLGYVTWELGRMKGQKQEVYF